MLALLLAAALNFPVPYVPPEPDSGGLCSIEAWTHCIQFCETVAGQQIPPCDCIGTNCEYDQDHPLCTWALACPPVLSPGGSGKKDVRVLQACLAEAW